jgi:hypothetical protein
MAKVKQKLKNGLLKVKEDFEWLKISMRTQADVLGTNEVNLQKIYKAQKFDEKLTTALVAYRDAEMQKAEQLAQNINQPA